MSTPRKPGESFEAYKLRCLVEKREERTHERGVLAWVSIQLIEKNGKTYKRSRQYIKPKPTASTIPPHIATAIKKATKELSNVSQLEELNHVS